MRTKEIILSIIMGLVCFSTFGQVDEKIKHEMFCSSLSNFSTAPNYLVVKVKDLNTGEIKEICTENSTGIRGFIPSVVVLSPAIRSL